MIYDFDDKSKENPSDKDLSIGEHIQSGEPSGSASGFEARSAEPESRYAEPSEPGNSSQSAEPQPIPTVNPDQADNSFNPQSARPSVKQYYEPWREPVYKESGGEAGSTYSPGHHKCSGYECSHLPVSDQKPYKAEKPPAPPRARIGFGRLLALVLACVILSSAAGSIVAYYVTGSLVDDLSPTTQIVLGNGASSEGSKSSDNPSSVSVTGSELSAGDIYDLACKQVVGINTSVTTTNIFGQTSTSAVSGSGFIISNDGYILTNYHVIEYARQYDYKLTVMLYDGSTHDASIVGHEEDNDVAVIKVDEPLNVPVTFGDSDKLKVGDTVYAVGNPLGELTYTMTSGMVSARDRVIRTGDGSSINMFQFDAAVNSGNSGGPVYNSKGEVVGIVTAKYSETGVEGLGFAIPINDAKSIAADLITNGYVTGKAQLGISAIDVESYVSQYYNIPEGAYVFSVNENSCAEKAGLKRGDVITKVGDTDVSSVEELKKVLRNYNSGDSERITVYRSGVYEELTVVFDEALPSSSSQENTPQPPARSGSPGGYQ